MAIEITDELLSRLDTLAGEATPGEWRWSVRPNDRGIYLWADTGMHDFVMDFVRSGMQKAQPRFQVDGIMQTMVPTSPTTAHDHAPDALHIAAANPDTVRAMVAEVRAARDRAERAEASVAALRSGLDHFAILTCENQTYLLCAVCRATSKDARAPMDRPGFIHDPACLLAPPHAQQRDPEAGE